MENHLDGSLNFALPIFEAYSENSEYASNKINWKSKNHWIFQLYLSY